MSFSLFSQDDTAIEEVSVDQELSELDTNSTEPTKSEFVAEKPEEVEQTADVPEVAPVPKEEFIPPATPEAAEKMAIQNIETEVEEKKKFNPYKSHWFSTFGFEAMEYAVPYSFVGEKEKFSEEKRSMYGGRLGLGGELYLGAGFMTSTRVEGFYMGTLFEKAKTADPNLPEEDIATTKNTGQIYGADIVQTLSFIWDIKVKNPFMDTYSRLTLEPFVEAGIGKAWAYNQKEFDYDTNPSGGGDKEEYDQSFSDELTNAKVGAGFNLTSSEGFFLYLKATQNRYDITNRRTKGYFYRNGDSPADVDQSNVSTKIDPVMIYSLGGGYKF